MFRSISSNISLAAFGFLVVVAGLLCLIEGNKMAAGSLFVVPGGWCIWGAFDNIRRRHERQAERPTIGDRLALPHLLFLATAFGAWIVASLAGYPKVSNAFGVVWASLFLALPITMVVSIFGLWRDLKRNDRPA